MNNYVPIAIVAYNRPVHLELLLNSLIQNTEFKESKIYFFIDKYKNDDEIERNQAVIEVCNRDWGLSQMEIIINETNLGLKKQILKTGDFLAEKYESFIILEDDLVVGKYFLNYMNKSLKVYKNYEEVFHVNGYNFQKIFSKKSKSYFSHLVHPWGWGTWSDKWKEFRLSEKFEHNLVKDLEKKEQDKFNFYKLGSYTDQLEKNDTNIISTWAVYWYQYIFTSNGYSLTPGMSLTENNGFDGTGQNSGTNNKHATNLNKRKVTKFPQKINFYNTVFVDNYLWHLKIKFKDYFEYHINKIKNKFK